MTKIAELGQLDNEICLFGGPYSNAHALHAVLHQADTRGIMRDHMICTGDIVAYCADPVACVDAMAGITSIAGNCEKQLAAGADDCGCGFAEGTACDLASKSWFAFAAAKLEASRRYFADLPDVATFIHHGRRYAVVHGGVTDIARFIWPTDPDAVFVEEINAIEVVCGRVDSIIAGHCGVPFSRDIGRHSWINAGVIGMPPHDGAPDTRFATLRDGAVTFHKLRYDHAATARVMRDAGLTQGYETALSTGFWPAEDILPPALRRDSHAEKDPV